MSKETGGLDDAALLDYIKRTPEIEVCFPDQAAWIRENDPTFSLAGSHSLRKHARAFHAHEQRIRAVEREACAKVCDEESIEWEHGEAGNVAARNCADAIRSRTQEKP